jgi:hypothetical protein
MVLLLPNEQVSDAEHSDGANDDQERFAPWGGTHPSSRELSLFTGLAQPHASNPALTDTSLHQRIAIGSECPLSSLGTASGFSQLLASLRDALRKRFQQLLTRLLSGIG